MYVEHMQSLCNNKQTIGKNEKCGLYEMKGEDCDAIHIGQSGRKIDRRIRKHEKYMKDKRHCHCII